MTTVGTVCLTVVTVFSQQDWPPVLNTVLSYPLSESPQEMSNDTFPSSHQSVMSYGLPKADCESTNLSQQRHFNAGGDIINNGWITSAVQTFGLSVEPFGTRHPQVGSTFLEKMPCEESHSDLSLISQDAGLHTGKDGSKSALRVGKGWRHNQRMFSFS